MRAVLAEAEGEGVSVDADDLRGEFDAVFDEEHLLVEVEGRDGVFLKAARTTDAGIVDRLQILEGGLVGEEIEDVLKGRLHAAFVADRGDWLRDFPCTNIWRSVRCLPHGRG